jgi:hypothetical protein
MAPRVGKWSVFEKKSHWDSAVERMMQPMGAIMVLQDKIASCHLSGPEERKAWATIKPSGLF